MHKKKCYRIARQVINSADFSKEGERAFLTEVSIEKPNIFTPEGKIIKTSIVGPTEVFEKYHFKPTVLSESVTTSNQCTKPSTKPDPVDTFKDKLAQVRQGQRAEQERIKQEKLKMRAEQRIVYSKDKKSLKHHDRTNKKWKSLSSFLSRSLKRETGDLVLNSGTEWRKKTEEIEEIDRNIPINDKVGLRSWGITLRNYDSDPVGEEFVPVGNSLSGLFACVKTNVKRPRELISSPYNHSSNSVKKTKCYRQQFLDNRNIQLNKRPMTVQGNSKLRMEVKAAFKVGLNHIGPLGCTFTEPEEIIEKNYKY